MFNSALCILVRNSLRYASKNHWGQITKQLKTICTAPGLDGAEVGFDAFTSALLLLLDVFLDQYGVQWIYWITAAWGSLCCSRRWRGLGALAGMANAWAPRTALCRHGARHHYQVGPERCFAG